MEWRLSAGKEEMIPVDIHVSGAKVKVKCHVGPKHLVQLINQESFNTESLNLVALVLYE